MEDLRSLYKQLESSLLDDYFSFLRFASISADPAHDQETRECCNWVANYLSKGGLETEILETSHHPLVYASYTGAGETAPTALIYGHYDVQPVDPLDEWLSSPFEPTVRDGQVYARGAVDDKGQILYAMAAVCALLKRDGKLPVNLKFCIEGEEETGSVGLAELLPSISDKLQADYLIIPDSGVPSLDIPAVTLGMRGILPLTIELTGSNIDLHSGAHGGIVYNPNHALVELLTTMRRADGSIAIPGFYESVVPLTQEERKDIFLDIDLDFYRHGIKAAPSGGERNVSPGESGSIRPTLEINGISGGYSGPGFKTVIPARASAKISCRLVPNQQPEQILSAIETFLRERLPEGITMKITPHGMAPAVRCSATSPVAQALAKAYTDAMEKPCRFILGGGSVPITAALNEASGAQTALFGLCLADDQVHAPNERFGLNRIQLGFLIVSRFIQHIGGES